MPILLRDRHRGGTDLGHLPARASKSGCRAANRNPPSSPEPGRGPAGGDGNGADRAPRCEPSGSNGTGTYAKRGRESA